MLDKHIRLIVQSAFLEGVEAGVHQVRAASDWRSEEGAPSRELWLASRVKDTLETMLS